MVHVLLICFALLLSFQHTHAARTAGVARSLKACAVNDHNASAASSGAFAAGLATPCNSRGLCKALGGRDACLPGQAPRAEGKIQSLTDLTAKVNNALDSGSNVWGSTLLKLSYRMRGMVSCVKGATADTSALSLQNQFDSKAQDALNKASTAAMQVVQKQPAFQKALAEGHCTFNPAALSDHPLSGTVQQVQERVFGADCQLDNVKAWGVPVFQHIRTRLIEAANGDVGNLIRDPQAPPAQVLLDTILSGVEADAANALGTESDKLTEEMLLGSGTATDSPSLVELRAEFSMAATNQFVDVFVCLFILVAIGVVVQLLVWWWSS